MFSSVFWGGGTFSKGSLNWIRGGGLLSRGGQIENEAGRLEGDLLGAFFAMKRSPRETIPMGAQTGCYTGGYFAGQGINIPRIKGLYQT